MSEVKLSSTSGVAGDRPRRPGQRVAEGFEGIVFGHCRRV